MIRQNFEQKKFYSWERIKSKWTATKSIGVDQTSYFIKNK